MDLEGVKAGITDVQKAVGALDAPGLADRPEEASEVGRHPTLSSLCLLHSPVLSEKTEGMNRNSPKRICNGGGGEN
jgi:hypothetical protein